MQKIQERAAGNRKDGVVVWSAQLSVKKSVRVVVSVGGMRSPLSLGKRAFPFVGSSTRFGLKCFQALQLETFGFVLLERPQFEWF
jgi:hypothetical protein